MYVLRYYYNIIIQYDSDIRNRQLTPTNELEIRVSFIMRCILLVLYTAIRGIYARLS